MKILALLFLPLLLLLHTTYASDVWPVRNSRAVKVHLGDLEAAHPQEDTRLFNDRNPYSQILVLSINGPTKVHFHRRYNDPEFKADAIVERPGKKICTFPAIKKDNSALTLSAYSLANELEIFMVIKNHDSNVTTDLYTVNMTDCRYTRTEIDEDFDDPPFNERAFIVLHPGNTCKLDIISFNGEAKCNAYMCKRVFNLGQRTVSKPMPFPMMDSQKEWKLLRFGPAGDIGYFALVMKGPLAKILFLSETGTVLKSTDEVNWHNMEQFEKSTLHEKFGMCYTNQDETHAVHCLQTDESLKFKIGALINVPRDIRALSVLNLPGDGGLMLITLECEPIGYCDDYEVKMIKVQSSETHVTFNEFLDDECMPKTIRYLTPYEEDGQICLSYGCTVKRRDGDVWLPNDMRIKCFDMNKIHSG